MQYELNHDDAVVVVVDMQRLFTEPASPYQNDASATVDTINELTGLARDAGVPVIHATLEFADDASDAGLIADWPQVIDGYFSTSSEWTDVDPRLVRGSDDHELARSRPSAFWGGELDQLLDRIGRRQIILAGLSLNNAVAFTAHDAFARDLPVFLVSDAVALAPFEDAATFDTHLAGLGTWASQVVNIKKLASSIPVNA